MVGIGAITGHKNAGIGSTSGTRRMAITAALAESAIRKPEAETGSPDCTPNRWGGARPGD